MNAMLFAICCLVEFEIVDASVKESRSIDVALSAFHKP